MKNAQKPLYFERIAKRWSRSPLILFALIAGLMAGGCGPTHQLPPSTNTETVINYVDSTILHIKDSVRITEATRYKDFAGLLDTLKIRGAHSQMAAWADTTRNIIAGELKEDEIKERERVVYRDRIQYRDSIKVVEKTEYVDRPVVEYKTPKWAWWSLAISVLSILIFGIKVYLKFKTKILK